MTKRSGTKRIQTVHSTDELERLTAEFDRENVVDEFHALSPTSRQQWERARTKLGRPRKGRGVKVIAVTVEKTLPARSDALAPRMGVSRAGLVERGLKAVLAAQGEA